MKKHIMFSLEPDTIQKIRDKTVEHYNDLRSMSRLIEDLVNDDAAHEKIDSLERDNRFLNKTLSLVKLYQKLSKAKTCKLGELNVESGFFYVKEGEISVNDGDGESAFAWLTACEIDSMDVGWDEITPEDALQSLQTQCKECKEHREGCWKAEAAATPTPAVSEPPIESEPEDESTKALKYDIIKSQKAKAKVSKAQKKKWIEDLRAANCKTTKEMLYKNPFPDMSHEYFQWLDAVDDVIMEKIDEENPVMCHLNPLSPIYDGETPEPEPETAPDPAPVTEVEPDYCSMPTVPHGMLEKCSRAGTLHFRWICSCFDPEMPDEPDYPTEEGAIAAMDAHCAGCKVRKEKCWKSV